MPAIAAAVVINAAVDAAVRVRELAKVTAPEPLAVTAKEADAPSVTFACAIVSVAAALGAVVRATVFNSGVAAAPPVAATALAAAPVCVIVTADPLTASRVAPVNDARTGPITTVPVTAAAFAGTTDKSPNPSEATATAETFFNEIVFTIFLSLSQIKEFLLPGW